MCVTPLGILRILNLICSGPEVGAGMRERAILLCWRLRCLSAEACAAAARVRRPQVRAQGASCSNLCVWRQSRASQARRRVGADGQQKGLELLVSRPAAGGRGLSQSGETEAPVLLPGTPTSSAGLPKGRPRHWTVGRLECITACLSPSPNLASSFFIIF